MLDKLARGLAVNVEWFPLITATASVIGILSILGAAYAVLRVNSLQVTLTLYRGEADAYEAKAKRLEAEHLACRTKLEALEQKYTVMEEVVTKALQARPVARRAK